jgi:hypothetical protein
MEFPRERSHLPQWAWIVAVIALIAGAVALVLSTQDNDATGVRSDGAAADDDTAASGSETDTVVSTSAPVDTASEGVDATTTSPSTTAATAGTAATVGTGPAAPVDTAPSASNEVPSTPPGATGDHAGPVPVGAVADIGGGWRLQILNVNPDAAAAVAEDNQFNEPPPPGSTFTLVTVALGYFGVEDPKAAFETTISATGAANVELANQCGVVPQALNTFRPLFSGGVIVGNVCFVTTPADTSSLQLYASSELLGGDNVFLDATTSPAEVAPMTMLPGPQPGAKSTPARLAPTPIGTAADIGEGWTLAVNEPASDITDAVLAENDFNAPPPDGFRFVGINVTYTYNGEGSASAFSVTANAVSDSNLTLDTQCGVTPDSIDLTQDIFPDGSVSGSLCFVVPAADSNLILYATANFLGANVMFATS